MFKVLFYSILSVLELNKEYTMLKTDDRLEYRQLLDEFLLGCKTEQRIGMEYERIPVSFYGKNDVP